MVSSWMKFVALSAFVAGIQVCGWAGFAEAQASRLARQTVVLTKGDSLPIQVGDSFASLAVSEPSIADASPVSTTEYYVRGRAVGANNILLYSSDGQLIQIVDLKVTPDIDAIRGDLAALFPSVPVNLYAVADRIHVSGEVRDSETANGILDVVESYAPERVIDALKVALPQQVLLEVRFVEASRDDIRELGFGSEISRAGDFVLFTTPGLLSGPVEKTAGTLFGGSGNTKIDFFLRALEEKGVLRTLAEPNLVARSGEEASFLAGGEFPVPVAAEDGQIRIEFKDFGVQLAFTPTVFNKDRIVLKVTPEVSQLDPRNSVRLSDVEIPALSVRKVDTTVELGNGQSFAIAGLMQNTYDSSVAQTPLLGSLPVIGALFRSSRYRNNESELVVIVTPRLVVPTDASELTDPMAHMTLPSEADRYLLGQVDADGTANFGQSTMRNVAAHAALADVSNDRGRARK